MLFDAKQPSASDIIVCLNLLLYELQVVIITNLLSKTVQSINSIKNIFFTLITDFTFLYKISLQLVIACSLILSIMILL